MSTAVVTPEGDLLIQDQEEQLLIKNEFEEKPATVKTGRRKVRKDKGKKRAPYKKKAKVEEGV
jgi:hypothetical protein